MPRSSSLGDAIVSHNWGLPGFTISASISLTLRSALSFISAHSFWGLSSELRTDENCEKLLTATDENTVEKLMTIVREASCELHNCDRRGFRSLVNLLSQLLVNFTCSELPCEPCDGRVPIYSGRVDRAESERLLWGYAGRH